MKFFLSPRFHVIKLSCPSLSELISSEQYIASKFGIRAITTVTLINFSLLLEKVGATLVYLLSIARRLRFEEHCALETCQLRGQDSLTFNAHKGSSFISTIIKILSSSA